MKKEIHIKRIHGVIDYNNDNSNFKISFKELTRRFGSEYIVICKAMWSANNNVMTEVEFMEINGDMPKGFFNNVIK